VAAEPRRGLLAVADITRLLHRVADRVAARGVSGRIYVVGGAAMASKYFPEGVERLPTEDIDAVFSPVAEIEEEVRLVAREEGLADDWFNNKARGYLPPLDQPAGELLFRVGEVEVVVAPPDLLLAMKLRICRLGRDDEDIAVLVRHLGLTGIEECDDLIERMYLGEERIPPNRRSVVEATFGEYRLTRAEPEVVLAPVGPRL
jgi:hypothetical protein